MLKKRFKLSTSEFKEVFNFGKTTKNNYFILKIKENNLPFSRFAVVISKKIAKKAVDRNYMRRRFFHALEKNIEHFSSVDCVFILNSSIKDLQYKDLLYNLQIL